MAYAVVFRPEARAHLLALYRYIAEAASADVAERYVGKVIDRCEALQTFPHQGVKRDDVRPGLRITHYRGRTVIVFTVESERFVILGLFHGGQDYEAMLEAIGDD